MSVRVQAEAHDPAILRHVTSSAWRLRWSVAVLSALVLACAPDEPEPLPPTAKPELVAMLRSGEQTPADSADGQGRAWLVESASDQPAEASRSGRWEIVFETGEPGIAEGGAIYLQVSPFWGWSTPQSVAPDAPGFTRVTAGNASVELEARALDQQLLGITVRGGRLAAGDRVRITYGAGPAGALADRYAESESRFWIAVDGDGDGKRQLIEDSPVVEVVAGPAARLVLHLPPTARPGDTVRLTAVVLDAAGNAGPEVIGELELESATGIGVMPPTLAFRQGDAGRAETEITLRSEGVERVIARGLGGLEATSNPLVVGGERRILWADLHGHSGLSDGTGTPADYLHYALDTAALDVVALTDHDHWGLEPLATHPEIWRRSLEEIERFNDPGRFVTLGGFEWTNWIYGHRHVLYFAASGEVLSSLDPAFEHPDQLWDALRGQPALTFAHHSAGGPIAIDWRIEPDSELEPLTEIVSVHGSSESADSPNPIYRPLAGNFVRDALAAGYRLGFVGSGDSHDGHPGLAHLASPRGGGLTGVLAEELSRESLLEALRARRTYATNGPRIVMRATLGGEPMGASVEPSASADLLADVAAIGPLESIQVIRNGEVEHLLDCGGELECAGSVRLTRLERGDYCYVRALQEDGGAAWSSPFFVD